MWDKLLSSRWCILIAALLGMLLMAPAMNTALIGDDYLHWSLLTGRSFNAQPGSFFGLFTFADGNVVHNQALIDSGQLVWWASDNLRIAFWRPLSELSQYLDYKLWPDSPVLMHLHNLLFYGLMIWLIGKLFSELDNNRKQANFATLLFAGNMLHVFAVAWLASRNQMLSGLFLVTTLLSYHRWRQGGSALYGVAAAACLILGLFSAEASIQTAAYLGAYALFYEADKPLVSRFKALLPFVVIVLVWKAVHSHLGYGSFGSPGYVDPAAGVGRFGFSLALRLPALMLAQWFGVSSVMFEQLDRTTQYLYSGAGTLALLGLAYAMYHLGAFRTALARFYGAGAVLALVPACAGYPFDRLTLNSDIGASGLLAIVLLSVWERRKQLVGAGMGTAKYLLLIVGFVHVVVFPIMKLGSSAMMNTLNQAGERLGALAIPQASADHLEHFMLVNSPSGEAVYYFPLTREFHGMRNPATMMAMGPDTKAMTLSRVDDTTLRLTSPTGFRGTITRDIQVKPFHVGDTVHMNGITVTVEELTDDKVPKTALFHFPDSVQSAHWRFFAWQGSGLTQLSLPAVGQSMAIAPFDLSKAAMDYLSKK